MTAQAHESYLRLWAQDTGCTIVSVDYSRAPEAPFPKGLYECFDAFVWACSMVQSPESSFSRILLAGDSAGGNFVLGVLQLAVKHGLPMPEGAILMYPATLLRDMISPARLMSFFDPMVNVSFLQMVQHNYSGGRKELLADDPLGSPAVMPDEILAQFPPIYCAVGTTDPLLDDAIIICHRLAELGREVSLNVWDGLSHGFCNMAKISKHARAAARHAGFWVRDRFFSGVTPPS